MPLLKVLFIGELNQTNTIICEHIRSMFECDISAHSAHSFFTDTFAHANDLREVTDLIIYDLNTSSGFRNVQENLKQIASVFYDIPLLAIDPYQDDKFTDILLNAGVQGILPVSPTKQDISRTIRSILKRSH